jgi:hypothetical protein
MAQVYLPKKRCHQERDGFGKSAVETFKRSAIAAGNGIR